MFCLSLQPSCRPQNSICHIFIDENKVPHRPSAFLVATELRCTQILVNSFQKEKGEHIRTDVIPSSFWGHNLISSGIVLESGGGVGGRFQPAFKKINECGWSQ